MAETDNGQQQQQQQQQQLPSSSSHTTEKEQQHNATNEQNGVPEESESDEVWSEVESEERNAFSDIKF